MHCLAVVRKRVMDRYIVITCCFFPGVLNYHMPGIRKIGRCNHFNSKPPAAVHPPYKWRKVGNKTNTGWLVRKFDTRNVSFGASRPFNCQGHGPEVKSQRQKNDDFGPSAPHFKVMSIRCGLEVLFGVLFDMIQISISSRQQPKDHPSLTRIDIKLRVLRLYFIGIDIINCNFWGKILTSDGLYEIL